MVSSQLQLTYLYYLELSLTVLQNYSLYQFLIKASEAPKSAKNKQQQQQQQQK